MNNKVLALFLTETIPNSSDDSDTSNWSDICSIKSEYSEDDDDDEDRLFFPLMQYLVRLKRIRIDDYLHIIESWTDAEFKNRLRLERKTAYRLIGNCVFF